MADDSKAIAHLKVMQDMAARYLEPGPYTTGVPAHEAVVGPCDGDAKDLLFIGDMIYMLDGTEQREAMAEEPVKLDCTAMFDRLDPL